MARLRSRLARAATLHRRAAAVAQAAEQAIAAAAASHPGGHRRAEQAELVALLRDAAARLAPGWLSAALDVPPSATPEIGPHVSGRTLVGAASAAGAAGTAQLSHGPASGPTGPGRSATAVSPEPVLIRVGVGRPDGELSFPVLVPLLGHGHLTLDADARDPRVAALLRSMALRLLAALPVGAVRIVAVDALGATFTGFPPPLTTLSGRDGLRALLAEAERWVREPGAGWLLIIIAALPELTEEAELARIAGLARTGAASRLHLVVAGWPPTALAGHAPRPPLPEATRIALRNPYAVIADPPGGAYGATGGLEMPVELDPDPSPELVRLVGGQLAHRLSQGEIPALYELLPDQLWQESAAAGLATPVGRARSQPLVLRFDDMTPHWMVGGRSGAGKTAFLVDVLYGLASRYGPDQLTLYLLDFKEGVSFTEFTATERDPSWIPQARAVGVQSDREYGVAVLRELDAEMTRRAEQFKRAGVSRLADLDGGSRVLCVIDEFQVLLEGNDRLAREAVALLEGLARRGRSFGIHLVLASQTVRGVEALYAKRDSIFGQFPVRVALPGGGDVLDPMNQAAAPLAVGEAVVNTAGGLGGPSGASRAHERIVRFPDPGADQAGLTALRHRLWQARPPENRPPFVFTGYAAPRLDEDATYQATRPGTGAPAALLGHEIDVTLSTARFTFDPTPGRHLAILGPSTTGADLLYATGRSLARAHVPGSVCFLTWSSSPVTGPLADDLAGVLAAAGHRVLRDPGEPVPDHTYLLVFGADGEGARLRPLLVDGPARGVHVIGWWRGLRRFTEDVGGHSGREDVAGMVFLNVPGPEVALLLGNAELDWHPRPERVLLHDRHAGRTTTVVPFMDRDRPR